MKCLVCGKIRRECGGPYSVSGLAFHRFPSNKIRAAKWLELISKPTNLAVIKCDGICSEHFGDDQYKVLPDLFEDCDPLALKKPKLNRTALPTLDKVFVRNWKERKYTEISKASKRPYSALSEHRYSNPSSKLNEQCKADSTEFPPQHITLPQFETLKLKTEVSVNSDSSEFNTDLSNEKHSELEHACPQSKFIFTPSLLEFTVTPPQLLFKLTPPQFEPPQLKTEPPQLKTEPSQLETEPSQLETEPTQLETEPSQLKTETSQLETEPSQLKTETSQLKTKKPVNSDSSDKINARKEKRLARMVYRKAQEACRKAHALEVKQVKQRLAADKKAHALEVKRACEAYRIANSHRVKLRKAAYRKANPLLFRNASKLYYLKNLQKVKEARQRYQLNNRQKIKEARKAYYLRCRSKCKNVPSRSKELRIAKKPDFITYPISIESFLTNSATICNYGLTTFIPIESPTPVRSCLVNLDYTCVPNSTESLFQQDYQPLSELSVIAVKESPCNDVIEIASHIGNSKSTQTDKKPTRDIGVQCKLLLSSSININPISSTTEVAPIDETESFIIILTT